MFQNLQKKTYFFIYADYRSHSHSDSHYLLFLHEKFYGGPV